VKPIMGRATCEVPEGRLARFRQAAALLVPGFWALPAVMLDANDFLLCVNARGRRRRQRCDVVT
jgi:hypothetical protein